jgi:hypothetical protein
LRVDFLSSKNLTSSLKFEIWNLLRFHVERKSRNQLILKFIMANLKLRLILCLFLLPQSILLRARNRFFSDKFSHFDNILRIFGYNHNFLLLFFLQWFTEVKEYKSFSHFLIRIFLRKKLETFPNLLLFTSLNCSR